ncbi:hypothetical protein DCC85_11740 [Paenibacillus sp. CAA11]|uniref:3D domain-containing protein n=1 Tax=Paenibacillus sp. CAA11 TaxID=1532905 RepID=UPI000D3AD012|nr:3D domain-containing protein [Paenibacillus sp. CAA11]AWB44823.1 hypothetical protein DCC85_11740 [Paenibacillus sp. CAA11]
MKFAFRKNKNVNKLPFVLKTAALTLTLAAALQGASAYAAGTVHTAKEGDTFYLLAKQYGVSVNQLMSANPSVKANNIYAGLSIQIPGENAAKLEASSTEAVKLLNASASSHQVTAWGKTFNYSNTINVVATAYSAAASENGQWGAVDYYGKPLSLGTIAVDPAVIPMGTKVLVTGHSHPGLPKQAFVATASDQGSAIKGKRIDIFIPGSQQSASQFGFQDVKLYVLN